MARNYSLRKSQHILHWCYSRFQKKKPILSQEQQASIENDLKELEKAIFNEERSKADHLAKQLETFTQTQFKKTPFEYTIEFGTAILLALFIAIIVRQVWFEPFQIPTGSMRPSYREQDYLTVTKTSFGLNIPLRAKHLYFDPDLIQRAGVVIFSAHNIPLP
ncbi:MAG: S26 family signal peptidase, partial [Waddliaceae bacterium]